MFKDVLRLIKETKKRFFAIAAIVFIGVAFMFGLLSNVDIMRISVDDFNKIINLQDIQIYSTFGFDENDIKAIKKLDVIDEIFASRTRDVYAHINESEDKIVLRVREIDANIDGFKLINGRLPIKKDECIVIDNGKCPINIEDNVDIYLEDEDIGESIITTRYKVVGCAMTSEYMSKLLSTSTLNNIDLDAVIFVPNNNFIGEYYTTLCIKLNGSDNYNSFSDGYYKNIKNNIKTIEKFADTQQYVLRTKIVNEAKEKIDDAKKELEKNKIDGQKELNDAYNELVDAKKKIDDGEQEIKDNETLLSDSKSQLNSAISTLKEKEKQLNDAISVVESSGMSLDDTFTNVSTAYNAFVQLNDGKRQSDEAISLASTMGFDTKDKVQIALQDPMLDKESEQYKQLVQLFNAFLFVETYDANLAAINAPFESSGGVESTYLSIKALVDGKEQVKSGYSQIESSKRQISDGYAKLEQGKKDLDDAKQKYQDGWIEYNNGLKEFKEKIADAEEKIKDAEDELNDLDDAKWIILDRDSLYSIIMYKSSCEQMNSIGIIMPFIFFLVAALVCSTTMKRLIDEQRGQIGIYSALGYSNFAIFVRYILYVIAASLLSSIIAIFVGVILFPTAIYNTWMILYKLPDIHYVLPFGKLVICVLSFCFLMCFVSIFVIRDALKEKPAELMRPKAPKSSKKIILERIGFIWNRLSFTSKITARNIFRYKSRFFMTIFGIAGCTGLLVLGFGIRDSISVVVERQYADFFRYDYTFVLSNDNDIDTINNDLLNDQSIINSAKICDYSAKIYKNDKDDGKALNCIVINNKKFDELFDIEDAFSKNLLSLNDNGIIVSQKFAEMKNIKVGDTILIKDRNGELADVKVTNICKMYFKHYAYMSENTYRNIFKKNIKYTSIIIRTDKELKYFDRYINEFDDIATIDDFSSFISNFDLMIKALDIIILVIIVTSGALAFVVLINLINVNISERIREIATLKVLGFKDSEVDSYIFKEILLLTIIGSILGLPLGYIELGFVMNVINVELIMFPIVIKPISYVLGFSITMLFVLIVFFLTKKTLKDVAMVESLKSIE